MGTGDDKEEISCVPMLDQGESDSSSREPSSPSHHDGGISTASSPAVNAMENDSDSRGHRKSSLQDNNDGHGDAIEEDRMSSSRLYGYEDPDRSVNTGSGRPNPERMIRRNVVTGESARFEMSYHPGRVHLYAPPRQRQKWGETQVLPRINWGDLFFDLYYVAAAYNISNILVLDASPLGYLYAAGTFFPILHVWFEHLVYSSRFVNDGDVTHSISRLLALLVIATVVLNIRPVDIMSHSSTEISMFVFCLCLCIERCLTLLRYVELYCFGVGQTMVIKRDALACMCRAVFLLVFYIAAMIVAAMKFFPRHEDKEHRLLADATTGDEEDEYQAATSEDSTTNIPIILCLVGIIAHALGHMIYAIFFIPSGGRHKQFIVPLNVGFMIHRNGEWISFMLGESIFSLLTVNVPDEGRAFFTTFYFGILTVVLLQFLHFQSQPHDPEDHAIRRNKNAGLILSNTSNIYSFALVCLGAAYTYFLTDFEDDDIGEARRLGGGGGGGGTSKLDDDALRRNASILFSSSLALIFLCLDIMNLLHLGIQEARDRLVVSKADCYKGVLFVLLRPCLTVFAATIWMWDNNPKELSVIGFCCVLAQLSLRKIGSKYMTHEQCHILDPSYKSNRRESSQLGDQAPSAAEQQGLPVLVEDESSSSDKEPANA